MEEKSVISTANEIVLQNTIGDELSLIRTAPNNLNSDGFQEILINSEVIGSSIYGLSNLTQTLNFSNEGLQLFTNTIPVTQLKQYANKTLSSMLKGDGGKIISHSGFKQVGTLSSTLANPAVAVTVLTTVIIKQQFNQINQKIDDIDSKLNSVIGMMHAEKLAVLQTIDARIKTITRQENISSANIQELSRQHIVRQVIGRNSQAGTPVLIRFFQGIKNAKSITVDRGREFAKYNEIEQKLGIPVYFAHPYSPEERGSNEILNRYVRRFIPKERKIETVSAKELDQINHWINARPMKTLNWQSPRKVFSSLQCSVNSCNLPKIYLFFYKTSFLWYGLRCAVFSKLLVRIIIDIISEIN